MGPRASTPTRRLAAQGAFRFACGCRAWRLVRCAQSRVEHACVSPGKTTTREGGGTSATHYEDVRHESGGAHTCPPSSGHVTVFNMSSVRKESLMSAVVILTSSNADQMLKCVCKQADLVLVGAGPHALALREVKATKPPTRRSTRKEELRGQPSRARSAQRVGRFLPWGDATPPKRPALRASSWTRPSAVPTRTRRSTGGARGRRGRSHSVCTNPVKHPRPAAFARQITMASRINYCVAARTSLKKARPKHVQFSCSPASTRGRLKCDST